MSTSITSSVTAQPSEAGKTTPVSKTQASLRAEFNASIVQASLDVSISTKNEPLALLYRSAIDSLNELLEPEFGPNAIENAASQDNSAEATAERIVSLSTGFFEAFKAQNPDDENVLESFMETIRAGFEKGYNEAVEILEGLSVFEGDIAADIQKTYELVMQGYDDFASARAAE